MAKTKKRRSHKNAKYVVKRGKSIKSYHRTLKAAKRACPGKRKPKGNRKPCRVVKK